MNSNTPVFGGNNGSGLVLAEQQNRVMRNTYWLLALSLVPTVIGALIGMQFKFAGFSSVWINLAVFMGSIFAFSFAINKTKDSPIGVAILLAFTFFMGFWLSKMLSFYLGRFTNGAQLIAMAAGGTAVICASMALLASSIKQDISWMGKFLMIGFIVLFIGAIGAFVFKIPALMVGISVLFVALFAAYLLYDLKQIIDGGETNYIVATMSIYLDVFGIFTNLLSVLGFVGGDD
jgi:modulator of FtsH protease